MCSRSTGEVCKTFACFVIFRRVCKSEKAARTLWRSQNRDLSERAQRQELGGLVGHTGLEGVIRSHGDPVEAGRDEALERAEVARVTAIESPKRSALRFRLVVLLKDRNTCTKKVAAMSKRGRGGRQAGG